MREITVLDNHPIVPIATANTDEMVHTFQSPEVLPSRSTGKRTVRFIGPTFHDPSGTKPQRPNVEKTAKLPISYWTGPFPVIPEAPSRHETTSAWPRPDDWFPKPYTKPRRHGETIKCEEPAILNMIGKLKGALSITFHANLLVQSIANTTADNVEHKSLDMASSPSPPDADDMARRIFLTYNREDVWLDRFMESLDRWRAVDSFSRTMRVWGIAEAELTRYWSADGRTIDRWLDQGVAPERREAVGDLAAATDILVRYLKRDRIPAVVRRPIRALDGDSLTNLLEKGDTRGVLSACRDMFRFERAHA